MIGATEQPGGAPRHITGWVTVPTGIAVTALLCLDGAERLALGPQRILLLGTIVSVVLALVMAANALNRATMRRLHAALVVLRDRQLLTPVAARRDGGFRPGRASWRYAPAVITLVLGLATTVMLQVDASGLEMIPAPPWLVVGGIACALLWTVVMASAANARRARRLSIEHRAALLSEKLTLDTLGSVPVLLSVCLPDGTRTAFNGRYLELTGRSESELAGRGWMESVHEHDRAQYESLFLKPPAPAAPHVELEYGMTDAEGQNRFIHEYLVPSWSDGQLAGYVATGIDITSQVKNETEQQKTIERLRNEMESQLAEGRREIAELSEKLEKLEKTRDRLQKRLDTAQETASQAKERVATARQDLKQSHTDLKLLTTEHQATKTENRKLGQSLARNEKHVATLESEMGSLREEHEHLEQQLVNMRESAELARRQESQLRAKVSRLTERGQQLEQEVEQARADRDQALDAVAAAEASADAMTASRNADLAEELRPQIEAALGASSRLPAESLGETEVRALDDARASVLAMSALVDGALGRGPAEPTSGGSGRKRSRKKKAEQPPVELDLRTCDLREAPKSVCAALEPQCARRGVKLRCVVDPNFPARVIADPVRVREVLIHLTSNALRLVDDDTLSVSLADDASTPTHVAARFEIRHDTARLERDELERRFATAGEQTDLESVAESSGAYRAAVGWRLVGSMEGTYGLETPKEGGFVVWFTVTLAKPERTAATASPVPALAAAAAPGVTAPIASAAAPAPSSPATPPTPETPAARAATTSPVYAPKDSAPSAAEAAASRPPVPRLPVEFLKSSLGDVLELGCDSLRLSSSKGLEGIVTVEIPDGDEAIQITANVESVERQGRRKHDVLLRYLDLMPQTRQRILKVAMAHRRRSALPINTIGDTDE